MGKLLREGLDAMKAKYAIIGDVRGRGLMLGVELVKDEKAGDRTPAAEATLRLFEETKKRGLLIGRGGLYRQRPARRARRSSWARPTSRRR